jgi:redox-sensing transcriptional repressor
MSVEPPSPSSPKRIPEATVLRLPVYQRILAELARTGVSTVSSEQLASLARVNAAKVRKDLSLLGSFGTRGSGYDPELLIAQIDRALGVDENWSVAIVGIGNLGRALTNSAGFASRGCHVTALFDVDPAVVGEEIRGMTVRHMDELARLRQHERPDIGVITTPGWAAQQVAELLVRAGVTSLLNFAPRVLDVPPNVQLRYVDLSIELQVLGFYRARTDDIGRAALSEERSAVPPMRSIGMSADPELG